MCLLLLRRLVFVLTERLLGIIPEVSSPSLLLFFKFFVLFIPVILFLFLFLVRVLILQFGIVDPLDGPSRVIPERATVFIVVIHVVVRCRRQVISVGGP